MNKRHFARLACTAIAAPLLMMLAYEMDGTGFGWLALPFYAPGLLIAGLVVPAGAASGGLPVSLQVAFALNFVFIWIMLLVAVTLVQRSIMRRKEQE